MHRAQEHDWRVPVWLPQDQAYVYLKWIDGCPHTVFAFLLIHAAAAFHIPCPKSLSHPYAQPRYACSLSGRSAKGLGAVGTIGAGVPGVRRMRVAPPGPPHQKRDGRLVGRATCATEPW